MNFRRNLGPSELWCWQSIYRSMIVSWVERRDEPVVVPCTLPHLYAAPPARCVQAFASVWVTTLPGASTHPLITQGTHPTTPVTTVSEHGNSLFTFGYYILLSISILLANFIDKIISLYMTISCSDRIHICLLHFSSSNFLKFLPMRWCDTLMCVSIVCCVHIIIHGELLSLASYNTGHNCSLYDCNGNTAQFSGRQVMNACIGITEIRTWFFPVVAALDAWSCSNGSAITKHETRFQLDDL